MGGIAGETKRGNTVLIDYGILNEESDIRAHVSVIGRCVYIYRTDDGIETISKKKYPERPAYTGNIVTAKGYLVPPSQISNLQTVDIPQEIMDKANFREVDSTTEKGDKAVRIVRWLLRSGKFPLSTIPKTITDKDLQISGTDILVELRTRIQVKCDYRSGDRVGCTGNLFIQIQECNPNRSH